MTRIPIEKKESIRWLENLEQSSATLADPARCVHIGDRESDIYELFRGFRRRRTVVPIEGGHWFRSIADTIPMIADRRSR
jgi:hypothetical protein